MKLKFINLLLAAFLLIGSAQALTSCKDTDEDLYAQLRKDQVENMTITNRLNDDLTKLTARVGNLETLARNCSIYQAALEDSLKKFATKTALQNAKDSLGNVITNVSDSLSYYVMKDSLNDLIDKYIQTSSLTTSIKTMRDSLKSTIADVDTLKINYDSLASKYTKVETRLTELESMLENSILGDEQSFQDFLTNTIANDSIMGVNIDSLWTAVDSLNAFKNTWESQLGEIEQTASDALAKATKNEADIEALTKTVHTLDSLLELNNSCSCDTAVFNALSRKVNEMEGKLNTVLADYVKNADMTTAISTAIAGLATQEALDTLGAVLRREAAANLAALESRLQEQIDSVISRLDGIDTKIGDINKSIEDLEKDMTQAKLDIQANKNNIEALTKSLDAVIVRIENLENRISGIIVQGTANPVTGYFKTPFGIESNFLMNYMGTNDNSVAVKFPNFYLDGVEYDGTLVLTAEDIKLLEDCGITGAVTYAPGATLFNDVDGNLGTVYLTINPTNIDLKGKTFSVVTSQNKEMPIELKNLRPSYAELTHGYSRTSLSPNGFYEADATVANGDVPALRVVVDQQLKSAAKKVLSERNVSSLAALGNAVYNQFNGFLPALGIRAAWDEKNGDDVKAQSVFSHYGLAAATFNPLSYKFLYGRSFRQIHLPDISGMLDDYKFNFSDNGLNIEFKPITIDGVNVNFSLNINPQLGDLNLGSVGTATEVEITNYPTGVLVDENDPDKSTIVSRYSDVAGQEGYKPGANGTATKVIPVDVSIDLNNSDLADNLKSSIQDALQNALSGLDDEINGQLQGVIDSLIGQIQGQVNDMMSSLENQVNTSLSDILGNLQDQVNGKIDMIGNKITNNALYSRLQAIVNRLNGILADPNHLLQPTLLYSMQGSSFGMFSESRALPTQFKGGSAVMLTPTTYTGEIVTPAFKKFVAVTNVYKSDDYKVNAQAGDAKCKSLAEAANAQPYMNEVVSGERRTIPFSYAGGEGYTFEIVYQALDYSGVTSTAKYYVSIKK